MRVLCLIVAAALLTGCATVTSAHRDGGSIKHGAAVSEDRLQEMADRECARFGKSARLMETDYISVAGTNTRYRCVE